MKTEQFCIRCGMSNLEIDGYNNCNVYGNNYGKHDFEPMNKLHDALKNEELMLEVGRKATEEQKAMTQSTVEERLDELVRDFTKVTPISKSECRDKLNDLLQLAEQKAREEIDKEWLSLNLRNDNKENWDSELTKFGLYMQGLSTK